MMASERAGGAESGASIIRSLCRVCRAAPASRTGRRACGIVARWFLANGKRMTLTALATRRRRSPWFAWLLVVSAGAQAQTGALPASLQDMDAYVASVRE